MKLRLNIKSRLTLWYLLILAVVLAFFSTVTYFMLSRSLSDIAQSPSTLTVVLPRDASLTDFREAGWSPHPHLIANYRISKEWLENLKSASSSTLSIYTQLGQITINQGDFISPNMKGEQQVQLFLQPSVSTLGSYEVLAYVRPVEVEASLAAFRRVLFWVIPITAFLAAGLGFLLVWRMLRPVNAITRTAREIGERDLSRRIKVSDTNDELGKLASTLNQTFERLQKAFSRERQFTSDASHELRTPLSIMRGEASLALTRERRPEEYRKSLEVISGEIDHMSSTIDKLLVLTRTDSGKQFLNLDSIDLAGFLDDLASDFEALCEDKSLHFKLDIIDKVTIEGDKVRLREMFLNLLDNAIRYTPPGGGISVSLTKKGNNAYVGIKDTGIGIPQEHLVHIFERFYRVDKASSRNPRGAGLGLAISQSITELHGGKIEVESRVGTGSTFRVILPLVGND